MSFYTCITLTHSITFRDHDYYFELTEYDLYLSVYRRPGLDEFLTYLRENTEPILFTKGVKAYAEKVLVSKKWKEEERMRGGGGEEKFIS